jgi:hypothetical protein
MQVCIALLPTSSALTGLGSFSQGQPSTRGCTPSDPRVDVDGPLAVVAVGGQAEGPTLASLKYALLAADGVGVWYVASSGTHSTVPIVNRASVGLSQGCGMSCSLWRAQRGTQSGEKDVEAAFELGGAVVGGQDRSEASEKRELADR